MPCHQGRSTGLHIWIEALCSPPNEPSNASQAALLALAALLEGSPELLAPYGYHYNNQAVMV